MNRNYNRNVSNNNSNHGNYNNYNTSYNNRNMNPSSNNFNNRYTQHNYDSRNDYKPQIKSELHSRDGNLDTKKIKAEMETNFDSDSIKKEKETDHRDEMETNFDSDSIKKEKETDQDSLRVDQEDSLRVDQEINVSKPSVKSNTVKSDKIKQVKSEPIKIEDVQTENSSGDTKCSRPIRASKRAKPNAKPIIDSEDSEEEEVDIKPIKRTRRQKVESSDDEYVPEEPIVNTTKAKSARTQKTTSAKVKSEDIDSGIKEKPARKPRVTKKVKLEENINTNITKNVTKSTKATARRSTKKAEPKQPRKSVKTEIDSEMCGEDVNSDCEKETTAKKRVGTKRKLKAPADTVENEENTVENEESETCNKKPRKVVQTNETYWSDESLLAEMCSCDVFIAWNFIKLIKSDNTIPFIARYRKEMVMNYEAEKLREMKQAYENILEIHHKAETILSKIEKLKKLTPELRKSIACWDKSRESEEVGFGNTCIGITESIACCKSLEELDLIYSPYKVGSKGTKAEKAKKLGLETPALELLNGEFRGDLRDYVKAGNTELNTVEKVQDGIQHIVADILAKDTGVLETLQELVKKTRILLESTKTKQAETIDNFDKYETYFSYSCDIKFVKPHAVLAINRGESNKVLSVNVKLNEWLQNKLFEFCKRKWLSQGSYSPNRARLFELSFQDSFKRLIKPFIVRSIRTQLNQTAEIASIQVFQVLGRNGSSNVQVSFVFRAPNRIRGSNTILLILPGYILRHTRLPT
ncbi:S1 RNA-binding domain-containing protein 1-like, partial [Diaphorina citri]|uniref:S1 RNA-binding domain-containing protein 1-like n=1 Tax=Diaphorina citri TaxID=121845 RepID=A0A1S3CZ04_DIACI